MPSNDGLKGGKKPKSRIASFSFYRESSRKSRSQSTEAVGEGLEMNSQNPEAYGAITVRTPPKPTPSTQQSRNRDTENTAYVPISMKDDLEFAGDNVGSEHYDMCFVAKLHEPLTQSELDALGKQENEGVAGPLDDSLERQIRGPLTGPIKNNETELEEKPHHVSLHQVT